MSNEELKQALREVAREESEKRSYEAVKIVAALIGFALLVYMFRPLLLS